jgi:serine/threonine-protein kinase RsbW
VSDSTSHDGLTPRPSQVDWQRHLRAAGTPAALPEIRQVVVDAAESCGFDVEDVIKLEMAVGEACTNIIEHAYSTQPIQHDIDLQLMRYTNRLEVVIQDYSSINFAVSETQTYDGIDDWISTGRRRGLGIYIIQSFVDKVEHRFVCGQGNELRLTKYFS